MKVVLLIAYLVVSAVVIVTLPPIVAEFPEYVQFSMIDAGQALLVCFLLAGAVGYFVYQDKESGAFLVQLFAWALLIRMLVAMGIFMFNMQEFFGGDAITYDFFGYAQMKAWQGDTFYQAIADRFMGGQASAWGMVNLIAVIYTVIGGAYLSLRTARLSERARRANRCYLRRVFPVARAVVRAGIKGCANRFLSRAGDCCKSPSQ
jgi:hypothetical protein